MRLIKKATEEKKDLKSQEEYDRYLVEKYEEEEEGKLINEDTVLENRIWTDWREK